jgi:Short C-terminal domain
MPTDGGRVGDDGVNAGAAIMPAHGDAQRHAAPPTADELAKLALLRDQGILSEEEFQARKPNISRRRVRAMPRLWWHAVKTLVRTANNTRPCGYSRSTVPKRPARPPARTNGAEG